MYSYDGWSFIQHMNELWIEGEVDGQKRYRMAEHLGFGWVSGASLEVDTIVPVNYVIKTEFVNPPIPDRSKDWCAFPEGQEEAGPYGWGRTEEEAIESFMENL
jgi:hypothetical protein